MRHSSRAIGSIHSISPLSPNTKSFIFKIHQIRSDAQLYPSFMSNYSTLNQLQIKDFQFYPGQWIDLFLPQIPQVGGFSIVSTRKRWLQNHELEFAIKKSKHPVVEWMHSKAQIGDTIQCRVGGNFYLSDEDIQSGRNLVFLAAGVGMTPLFSMISHLNDVQYLKKSHFLYSVKRKEEILYMEELKRLTSNVSIQFHLTNKSKVSFETSESDYKRDSSFAWKMERISRSDLQEFVNQQSLFYLCGPLDFLKAMSSLLIECNVDSKDIKYEKWW